MLVAVLKCSHKEISNILSTILLIICLLWNQKNNKKISLRINYDLQWHPQNYIAMQATQKRFPQNKFGTYNDEQHRTWTAVARVSSSQLKIFHWIDAKKKKEKKKEVNEGPGLLLHTRGWATNLQISRPYAQPQRFQGVEVWRTRSQSQRDEGTRSSNTTQSLLWATSEWAVATAHVKCAGAFPWESREDDEMERRKNKKRRRRRRRHRLSGDWNAAQRCKKQSWRPADSPSARERYCCRQTELRLPLSFFLSLTHTIRQARSPQQPRSSHCATMETFHLLCSSYP